MTTSRFDDSILRTFPAADVAARLNCSSRTVTRMLDAGVLKTVRPRRRGRPIMITAASLQAVFEAAESGVAARRVG